ncbi:retrograde regulation protein 2 [Entomophthora muscae]|nr:retrograde regulation protein 2 [Entomophthora muscae]
MNDIILEFRRFKQTLDTLVGEVEVKVVATESLRTATNSKDFQKRIHDELGWSVQVLSKIQEANTTSLGVISSFYKVDGLVMDLGGGSVEFNLVQREPGELSIRESPEPQSFPFGAALLRNQLQEEDPKHIKAKMVQQIEKALPRLKIVPASVKSLYWSGGGFRAIGYAVIHNFNKPIPIINGFRASREEVQFVIQKYKDSNGSEIKDENIFRVGGKRSKMLNGCCLLASVILKTFDQVEHIYFSGGGVRQGIMYNLLTSAQKKQDPLLSGIRDLVLNKPHLPSADIECLKTLLSPLTNLGKHSDDSGLSLRVLETAVYTSQLYIHHSVESRASCALQLPLSGGDLANLPGLLHPERACLALILMYRYGGDVKDSVLNPIKSSLPKKIHKQCKLIGHMLELCLYLIPISNTLNGTEIPDSVLKDAKIQIDQTEKESDQKVISIILLLPSRLKASNTFVFNKLLSKANNKHFQIALTYSD